MTKGEIGYLAAVGLFAYLGAIAGTEVAVAVVLFAGAWFLKQQVRKERQQYLSSLRQEASNGALVTVALPRFGEVCAKFIVRSDGGYTGVPVLKSVTLANSGNQLLPDLTADEKNTINEACMRATEFLDQEIRRLSERLDK